MSKSLSAFLSGNVKKTENLKIAISDRFVGEDGTPIEWEIKTISDEEADSVRNACAKSGKNGLTETDTIAFMRKLACKCVVYPDLANAELQDSYGAMGAEALLGKMLTLGEYTKLAVAVQKANGLSDSFDELVEDAKN